MCRLFGLIANKEVDIYFSMQEASKSFKVLGKIHRDGWGIGWYEKSIARIEKKGETAPESEKFVEVSREVKSKIFIAHVRLASCGNTTDKNSHPFRYVEGEKEGKEKYWIFAHNGTVDGDEIMSLLIPPYDEEFTSQPIDSEIYFRFILQCINKEGNNVEEGIKRAVQEIIDEGFANGGANFLLSDGKNLYGFKYGNHLYYLERDPGDVFWGESTETRSLIEVKRLAEEKAVIIASEEMTSDEDWKPLKDGDLIIVTKNLQVRIENIID